MVKLQGLDLLVFRSCEAQYSDEYWSSPCHKAEITSFGNLEPAGITYLPENNWLFSFNRILTIWNNYL